MQPIIETRQLTRILPGEIPVTLVNGANVKIMEKEFVAITGPSGSGKSSLLYLLGLLDRPTSGSILWDGRDITALSDEEWAQIRLQQIGFVFQFHFLLPEFSALENVMLPMKKLNRLSSSEQHDKAAKLLTDLGMGDHIEKLPRQLSGGQSQRVAIARALANDPKIICADEPTGNLDTVTSQNVQSILRGISSQSGRAVVVVTHDADFAAKSDRVIHIVDGKIRE